MMFEHYNRKLWGGRKGAFDNVPVGIPWCSGIFNFKNLIPMSSLKSFSKQFPFYSNGRESDSPGSTSTIFKPQSEEEPAF